NAKAQRDNITFDRCLPAGQTQERLTAPCCDVKPFAVLRNFNTVRPCGLAARYFGPTFTGMPFPEFAVVFTRHHFGSGSIGVCTALQIVGRDKATIVQTNNGVQSDRISRYGAPDPCQDRHFSPTVHVEHFNGLPFSMMYRIEYVRRVSSGVQS